MILMYKCFGRSNVSVVIMTKGKGVQKFKVYKCSRCSGDSTVQVIRVNK